MTPNTMKPFMEPRSVALIGISRAIGPDTFNILENIINAGFSGRVYPVNPHADEILGIKVYPSVREIPEECDLAVITVSRSEVLRNVWQCTQRGIRAITIISQGFADADDEGRKMQAEIVRITSQSGARVLGPNTWGTLNAFNNFTSGIAPAVLERIPIGFITQTGFFFHRPPVVGKGIDLGNTCDIDFADGMEYFENDPDIKVLFLHIEGIRDGKRFMEVARRVARKKPIVAVKAGRKEEAARAAQSHTGMLVGRDEVYDAAFRQCGVIRVGELHEFEDLAKAFLNLPLMRGPGIAVITGSGGGGVMAIDIMRQHDLRLALLSPETLAPMNALAPPWQRINNPCDIWAASGAAGHPLGEVFLTSLDALLQDQSVHGVVVLFYMAMAQTEQSKLLEVIERADDKPVVCSLDLPEARGSSEALEKTGKVSFFPTMERALRALSRLNERRQYLLSIEQGS